MLPHKAVPNINIFKHVQTALDCTSAAVRPVVWCLRSVSRMLPSLKTARPVAEVGTASNGVSNEASSGESTLLGQRRSRVADSAAASAKKSKETIALDFLFARYAIDSAIAHRISNENETAQAVDPQHPAYPDSRDRGYKKEIDNAAEALKQYSKYTQQDNVTALIDIMGQAAEKLDISDVDVAILKACGNDSIDIATLMAVEDVIRDGNSQNQKHAEQDHELALAIQFDQANEYLNRQIPSQSKVRLEEADRASYNNTRSSLDQVVERTPSPMAAQSTIWEINRRYRDNVEQYLKQHNLKTWRSAPDNNCTTASIAYQQKYANGYCYTQQEVRAKLVTEALRQKETGSALGQTITDDDIDDLMTYGQWPELDITCTLAAIAFNKKVVRIRPQYNDPAAYIIHTFTPEGACNNSEPDFDDDTIVLIHDGRSHVNAVTRHTS